MAKTNFTKVEEALNEGLRKMGIANLLDMASLAAQIGDPSAKAAKSSNNQTLAAIQFELKHCKDESLFSACGISRQDLKSLLATPDSLTEEQWTQLRLFREKADTYKKEQASKLPPDINDQLVEAERKKHINKRYNKKDTWLPLH